MKHRYTFLAGVVVGVAIGVFVALLLTAPPTEQQVRERQQREAAALRAAAAFLQAYSQTITNAP